MNGNLDIFVDSEYIVVVLANYDRAAGPLAQSISEWIHSTGDGN